MGFQALDYAQQMRDVIREFVGKEINRLRPDAALATVASINSATNTCTVLFPGDTVAVPVKMYTVQPRTSGAPGVGDVVRVAGNSGSRYVADVVAGSPFIKSGVIALTALQTTGSSANMFVDSVTGLVSRVTSSKRYKKNIKKASLSNETFSKLRAVTYNPKESEGKFLGVIAEELADLHDPVIDLLVAQDETGEPDAVHYDRIAVVLIPVIQQLIKRVDQLEKQMNKAKP